MTISDRDHFYRAAKHIDDIRFSETALVLGFNLSYARGYIAALYDAGQISERKLKEFEIRSERARDQRLNELLP